VKVGEGLLALLSLNITFDVCDPNLDLFISWHQVFLYLHLDNFFSRINVIENEKNECNRIMKIRLKE